MANKKEIEIRIITNGYFDGTRIYVDGKEWVVKEINFSAAIPRRMHGRLVGGKCNFQAQREVNGEIIPVMAYGDAFEKIAEARELNKGKDDEEHTDETGIGQ